MWPLRKELIYKKKKQYRIRLHASARLTKTLLNGSLVFCGHDESEKSLYRGNFIKFLKVFGELNEEIGKVILSNAPGNNQMTSPSIQKELCNCFAEEVLKKIFEELGDDVFSIFVDESRDISKKEQMAMVLTYVDKLGFVKERFIGLVHVMETTALSLKAAIDKLFARYNLSIGRVRGQGYDGARNISCEFSGLKALILKENPSAYYVHCFAHQLQLVVVALATKHHEIFKFFKEVSNLVNVVVASCKRIDLIRESQRERLGLNPEVETGSGKNQELSLEDITSFCDKYDIEVVDMKAEYVDPKYRRRKTDITNHDHYVVNNFNMVLNLQIQELGNRFNELVYELGHYIANVKEDKRFDNLNGVGDLAKMMVKTRLHIDYLLVYRLIKLSLVFPVATANIERCFSSMKIVKTDSHNRMSDEYVNDSCICYIEREFLQ
ncbi:uncharacterized protein LOC143593164 [Bidens hawaiensis]|uniref:uncharacterized protein LOC143593164 n=1 Tax=Bidens hawaiensis TaxID=980011 RepID=UPI004048F01A